MPKRRADADHRCFLDEFESVRVSRFRAMGIIDPSRRTAVIPFPNGTNKVIGVGHTKLKYGGGWSYFRCPKCDRRTTVLHLIDDAPLCWRCCDAMNIKHRSKWGLARHERLRAADQHLDRIIAKLETAKPLRFNGAPASWGGKAQLVYRSRRLTERMRRSMITLRLSQIASQQANDGVLKIARSFKPRTWALTAIPSLGQVWRARSTERLEQALDNAQSALLRALESDDPRRRLSAARLMLRTRQGRERGFRT
jgi:hypothetical protein